MITTTSAEFELPSYATPGNVLVRVYKDEVYRSRQSYIYFEVYAYDSAAAPFWINEGTGIEYWLEQWFDLDMADAEAWFVIEDITGEAGTDYTMDGPEGWEEFYPGNVRYATEVEINSMVIK